jgi:hypothetical protein
MQHTSENNRVRREFGITLGDAERLARRANYCQVFFKTGEDANALFEIPKSTIAKEIKIHGRECVRPCELAFMPTGNLVLTFGGCAAVWNAEEKLAAQSGADKGAT